MKPLLITVLSLFSLIGQSQSTIVYDIVLSGGRVIDPETKLDAIRNIGIIDSRIAQISAETLSGKEVINVKGLVVSPGFIDPHVHGISNVEQEYQLYDGVTTALELELGIPYLETWYKSRQSKALINYGGAAAWSFARFLTFDEFRKDQPILKKGIENGSDKNDIAYIINQVVSKSLTEEQTKAMLSNVQSELDAGGIGIGVPIGYYPGATLEEVYRVYQMAAQLQTTIITHVREPNLTAVQQAISDAVLTGAPLHIVHLNSMALGQINLGIQMVQAAQKRGFDITTEVYPYTAASTRLQSNLFADGWKERLNIDYHDLQWVATGERLTKESFEKYKKTWGHVIIHMMKPEWLKSGIAADGVMIGSDGMPYAQLAHPRTAGTFARVLGKYVREDKVLDLPTAISKMTYLPAKMLEKPAPMMRFKGRLQVGADADITIFNPDNVIDKATFEDGLKFSQGIEYVIVNGTIVLKKGKMVTDIFPGQAIYGKFKK